MTVGPILRMFVVYERPTDYPDSFVVRAHYIESERDPWPDPMPLCVVTTLDEAREAIPSGAYRLDRHPEDDPKIVEVWI